MNRRVMTVQLEVPDSKRVLVAVRHIPNWESITQGKLSTFAQGHPEWAYLVAGEQASRSLLPGSRLVRTAVVDHW